MSIDTHKAYGQKIIFQFLEHATGKGFTNKTAWDFEVKTHEDNAKNPRWAVVVLVGPDVPAHIQPGNFVMIEPLMWTHGFEVDTVKYWATDHAKVIGAVTEKPTGIY